MALENIGSFQYLMYINVQEIFKRQKKKKKKRNLALKKKKKELRALSFFKGWQLYAFSP